MAYRLAPVTSGSIRDAPPPCVECVFWQARDGRTTDKERWAARVEDAWGAWGTLYVAEGKWRDDKGHELPDPDALAVGRTRGGAVVNPEGEEVPAAPNVQPQMVSDAGSEDAISPRMRTP